MAPLDPPASDEPAEQVEPVGTAEIVAAAAIRAPSGGNAQPWHIEARDGSVSIRLAPEHSTTMDVGYRASAVALGAATFNARVAAAAHGLVGNVDFQPGDEASPLSAIVHLSAGDDPELSPLYEAMLRRETNRRRGDRVPIPVRTLELLDSAARSEGARLHILSGSAEVDRAATILAEADRIRYLTPQLHAEMFAELRSPGDPSPESGIDVRSLELESSAPGDARYLAAIGSNGEPRGVERRNRAGRRHLWAGDRERCHRRDLRARPESDRLCPRWIGRRIGVDQSTAAWACRPTRFTSVSLCARR